MKLPGLLYTSPDRFSARQRLALTLAPFPLAAVYKTLARSCWYEFRGVEYWDRVMATHGHAIMAFWHETLGLAAYHFRNTGYHTLTSYSFDGEIAARVVQRFGLCALRGSSSRGGSHALAQLEKAVIQIPAVGFTLDGPRGPRRVAKPGVAILSTHARVPIIPTAFAASRVWRLNSWDRFIVPKPFGRIVVAYGEPILPPETPSAEAIELTRLCTERALNTLHLTLEEEVSPHSQGA